MAVNFRNPRAADPELDVNNFASRGIRLPVCLFNDLTESRLRPIENVEEDRHGEASKRISRSSRRDRIATAPMSGRTATSMSACYAPMCASPTIRFPGDWRTKTWALSVLPTPILSSRNDVEKALQSHFGSQSIVRGIKAFDIHENTYHIDADAVACFEHRRYHRRQNGGYYYHSETEFHLDNAGSSTGQIRTTTTAWIRTRIQISASKL